MKRPYAKPFLPKKKIKTEINAQPEALKYQKYSISDVLQRLATHHHRMARWQT